MNELIITFFIIIFGCLMALIVYVINQLVKSKDDQVKTLTMLCEQKNDQIVTLREELDNLKSRKRLRQTRPTEAALLDMRAQINNIKFQLEAEEDQRAYFNRILDRMAETVAQVREDPYAYDPDTPCVQREQYQNAPAQCQCQETLAREDNLND